MIDPKWLVYGIIIFLILLIPKWTLYLIIFLLVYVVWHMYSEKYQEGFSVISVPFGEINDNISIGNPSSWSNRINPSLHKNKYGERDAIIYHGYGIPLPHEDRPTKPVEKSMVYLENYKCAPECCPSVYTCDNGCVCWEPKPFLDYPTIHSQRTGPTS